MNIDDKEITRLMGVATNLKLHPPIIIQRNTTTLVDKPLRTTKVRFIKELEENTFASGVTFDFKYDGEKFEPLTKPINFRSNRYIKYLNMAKMICDELLNKLNSNG